MKKLALTNLMLLMAIKSVSACTYGSNADSMSKSSVYTIYFFTFVFLVIGNIILFFLRDKKDYLLLILIIGTASLMLSLNFFGVLLENCDFLDETLKWEFIIFLPITVFHIGLWITKSRLHLWSKQLNLPSIKPR